MFYEDEQMSNRGDLFEKNRREYWNNRSDTIDVFRDTYGPTDLAVIFKRNASRENKILLIEAKLNGYLSPQHQEKLQRLLRYKPESVELRIEFLRDSHGLCGRRNTTYTTIKSFDDVDRHTEKVRGLRDEEMGV